MTDDIKAIRDALADPGLTHGEWVACGPSFGEPLPRYLNEVIRPDDADGGDTVARALEGMEADSSADMAYIAAVHPERIARLLDALERAQAALSRITDLDPATDSEEGYNEWGEADCFNQAQKIAAAALKRGA